MCFISKLFGTISEETHAKLILDAKDYISHFLDFSFSLTINCQNPNLTTTQPNLNLVGFDTIITLHPPTHHHPPPQELYFYQK